MLEEILKELGISTAKLAERGLSPFEEAPLKDLVVVELDAEGRPFILEKRAARAWTKLSRAAKKDSVHLLPFSGFRSFIYQRGLVARNLEKGRTLDDVLAQLAPPGYSEHHTGRAVDLTTAGVKPLTEDLENSATFSWLLQHAEQFDFRLSFPRNNPLGFIYEPWHWCFKG